MKNGRMGWRRVLPLAAFVLAAGLAMNVACKSESLLQGCSATLSADKAEYAKGEPVRLQLTLVNDEDDLVTLTFSSSQIYDFWAQDAAGSEVWRWSDSRVFAAVITHVDLMPGASAVYAEIWDQLKGDKAAVPAGTYTIHARVLIADPPEIDPVTITIR